MRTNDGGYNIFRFINKDLGLLCVALISLVVVVLVELRVPPLSFLKSGYVGDFLTNEITRMVSLNVALGVLSAYIFYVFLSYIPERARKKKSIAVLNCLAASVIDTYDRCHAFGHELLVSNVRLDFRDLDLFELKQRVGRFEEKQENHACLRFAMFTADSRLDDFRNCLMIASQISPAHALQWLNLSDKVRLLAECYGRFNVPDEIMFGEELEKRGSDIYYQDCELRGRLSEYIEEVIKWKELVR